ncbi:hypothetical protein [Geobacter sp. FeAm09]|uniref:hypothetical protein n=1 Tax=Geobacter sp. FeAm09 TaxID=2597769 RepID=UPI00197AC419|nr:hypothetical protein [Geobacter sp. FeAm09]
MVTIVGFAGWLAAALIFLFAAFPERGRFEKRPAMVWGGVLAVCYAVWVAGLLNA